MTNLHCECILLTGIGISGGFEVLIFWRFFSFDSTLLLFMLFYTLLLSFIQHVT